MKLEVKAEELAKYSIFIGTPMYGGNCSGMFTQSMCDLTTACNNYGIALRQFFLFNESLIQRARNYIVDQFLRSDCTHLMFIDGDIGFHPMSVLSLLGIQTTYPDQYDVLAGPYPKKSIAWEKVFSAISKNKVDDNPHHAEYYGGDFVLHIDPTVTQYRLDEPVAAYEVGTGFMLIPRYVFERMAEAYPETRYTPDHTRMDGFDGVNKINAFFDCEIDPETKRYLSEDYLFCKRARNIDVKIHLCPWMELHHIGTHVYKGSLAALASIEESFTASEKSNPSFYNKPTAKKKRPNRRGVV